jgi:Uma2 family endonuclease
MRAVGVDDQTTHAPLTLWRWKRAEYDRLVDLGAFDGNPIELIGGHLVVAEPQSPSHASAVQAVDAAVRAMLPPGVVVSVQIPVSLDDESEPEPDLAVTPGRPDRGHAHPGRPVLIVEVAETSLALDRQHKGSLYARADIRDYWIVNLADRVLEVYQDPTPDASAPYGWRYHTATTLAPPAAVIPLAFPAAGIAVADMLP